jgi:hypothetical protein
MAMCTLSLYGIPLSKVSVDQFYLLRQTSKERKSKSCQYRAASVSL